MPSPAQGRAIEPMWGRRVTERDAWDALQRCCRELKLNEIPIPVPVDDWIERALGIRFSIEDLSRFGENVLGAAFVADREILVDERVLKNEGRFRFTCAHELGHVLLHRGAEAMFREPSESSVFEPLDRYEREADRFAAAFLMPVPMLEIELVRVLDQKSLHRGKVMALLMQPTIESEWLWRRVILPHITSRFAVSLAAAIFRFGDVQPKILAGEPLLPREFVGLLQRNPTNAALDGVSVSNGIPVHSALFRTAKGKSK